MLIRSATTEDIPAIAHLHVAGWQGAYGGIVDQSYLDGLDAAAREKQWRGWFDQQNNPVLMAFDDAGIAAGFVNYGRLRTPPPGSSPIRPLYSGEIFALYLLPEYYRQGIGTALMRSASSNLRDMKHKSLCLWVLEKNERGVSFYKKMGGERCGKKDATIGPTATREICFGWRDIQKLMI